MLVQASVLLNVDHRCVERIVAGIYHRGHPDLFFSSEYVGGPPFRYVTIEHLGEARNACLRHYCFARCRYPHGAC